MKITAEQAATLENKMQFARVAVESKLTKNAPYSAEAVTESTQLLADGNRIVTKSASRVFRDGEARTRREQLNQAGTDAVNITISDPVAGNTYILDPATHVAFRNGFIMTTPTGVATATFSARGRGGGGAVLSVNRPTGQSWSRPTKLNSKRPWIARRPRLWTR